VSVKEQLRVAAGAELPADPETDYAHEVEDIAAVTSAVDRPLFLSGDKSPVHLGERTRVLAGVMPHATVARLPGQGHSANDRDPALVAGLIAGWAAQVGVH